MNSTIEFQSENKQKVSTHFLLVEDDDAHAELVELSMMDVTTPTTMERVSDGAAALDYLHRRGPFSDRPRPDVILLDLNLPRVSGHDVLRQIKANDALRTIPVVVLTTSGSPSDRHRAYDNSVNSYLVKPVEFGAFQELIADVRCYWSGWNTPPA